MSAFGGKADENRAKADIGLQAGVAVLCALGHRLGPPGVVTVNRRAAGLGDHYLSGAATRPTSTAPPLAIPGWKSRLLRAAPGELNRAASGRRYHGDAPTAPGTAHEDGASWQCAGWLAPIALPIM